MLPQTSESKLGSPDDACAWVFLVLSPIISFYEIAPLSPPGTVRQPPLKTPRNVVSHIMELVLQAWGGQREEHPEG